jgi:hypothetical protein
MQVWFFMSKHFWQAKLFQVHKFIYDGVGQLCSGGSSLRCIEKHNPFKINTLPHPI